MKSVYTLHYIPPETSVHNFAPIQKHLQEEVGMTASRTSSRKFFLALRKAPAWLQLGFALSLAGMAYRSALYKLSSKLMRWGSNHIILNIFWPGLNMTMFMLFGFDWMFDKILTQVSKWVDLMSSLQVCLETIHYLFDFHFWIFLFFLLCTEVAIGSGHASLRRLEKASVSNNDQPSSLLPGKHGQIHVRKRPKTKNCRERYCATLLSGHYSHLAI